MKKIKGFRMFIALVLAAAMVLPCFAALAEEAEVSITVTPNEEDESKKDVLIEVDGDIESASVINYENDPDLEVYIDNSNDCYNENKLPAIEDVSSITVEIDGDVTNEHGETGITVENAAVPALDVTAGEVRVHESDDSASSEALRATVDYGDVTVQTESLEASATGYEELYATGLYVTAANNGSFEANTGDITSTAILTDETGEGGINNKGVAIISGDESQISVDAGKIEVSTEWESDPAYVITYGVNIIAHNNSTVRVDTGDISLSIDQAGESSDILADGIRVLSDGNADVTVVSENITAETDGNQEITGAKIDVFDNSSTVVASKGDITAEGGNSTGVDLYADTDSELETPVEIFADGAISGGKAAISASESSMGKANVTAWKIEGGEDGTVVAANRNNENITDKVQSSIHYIVKLADGFSNSDVTTQNGDTVTVDYDKTADAVVIHDNVADGEEYTYHTARENEQVSLTFDAEYDPDEGDTLDVLYNADDKDSTMTQGTVLGKGIFSLAGNVISLLMNRGGGMKLSASVNHAHKYVSKVTEPTCTAQGYTTHTCSRCGDSYVDSYVDAKGHTEVTDAAVAATCTETGLTEGKHCSVCKEVLVRQEVVAAKGHTEVTDAAVAPTCTETGLTKGKHCSVCNEVLVKQEVVQAAGHEFEEQLTADKKTHWYACKNCDAKKDEANHIPGTPVKGNEQLAKNGAVKSYEEVTYCTVCGAVLSRETILGQDAIPNPDAEKADIAEGGSMTGNDIDINAIPMSMDVSSDNDDVNLDKLANCPDTLKERAKEELSALKRSGYKIDCGCGAWSKSGMTAACTLKLSEKDVPDGSQIFVNGAAVSAELKDGYYYFDITLPAVVLVAHK